MWGAGAKSAFPEHLGIIICDLPLTHALDTIGRAEAGTVHPGRIRVALVVLELVRCPVALLDAPKRVFVPALVAVALSELVAVGAGANRGDDLQQHQDLSGHHFQHVVGLRLAVVDTPGWGGGERNKGGREVLKRRRVKSLSKSSEREGRVVKSGGRTERESIERGGRTEKWGSELSRKKRELKCKTSRAPITKPTIIYTEILVALITKLLLRSSCDHDHSDHGSVHNHDRS